MTSVKLTPWFQYQDEGSLAALLEHADALGGISMFGEDPAPAFFAACRAHEIETLLLVGGSAEAFDTPAHARATIDRFLTLCETVGYGGIDLDYEHIPPEYVGAYADFMRQLSRELRAAGRRMSICVHGLTPAEYGHPRTAQFYTPAVLAETCDEVRVMCYDYYFAFHGITGPTTDWLWAREVMRFWMQDIPAAQMVMGLPAYGNDFPAMPGDGMGKQVSYEHPEAVPGAHEIEHTWLHRERLNFYRYLDAGKRPRTLFATDADSTGNLLAIVDELHVPSISFWYYQTMTPGIWRALERWMGG